MRRLNCRTVRDLLPLHCGGDLPTEKAIAVDQHLHACLVCFREYRDFAAMRGRLGVLAEEPLPSGALDGFTEEVMARLIVNEEGPAAELPSRNRWRQFDGPAVRLAAAAALVLAVGFGLWQAELLPGLQATAHRDLRETLASSSRTPLETAPKGFLQAQPETGLVPARDGLVPETNAPPQIIFIDQEQMQHMPAFLLQVPFEKVTPSAPFGEGLHPETGRQLRPRDRN